MTTKNIIDNELLEEKLEAYKREILADVNQLIINVLNQKQQPGRSPDALLHKRLTDIAQENAPDAPKLVIAAIAEHFKDLANGVIYQHLSNIYRSLN